MFTLPISVRTAIAGPKPPQRPVIEIRELVVALLFVHLTANASLITRVIGPRWAGVPFGGCALLMYCGAVAGRRFTARRSVGWVASPWQQCLGAALVGCLLASIVTAATVAFGHSTRVTEPIYNQVLAVTLGPILEEVCLRGVLVLLLARLIGPTWAVFVTGVAFALLHLPGTPLKLVTIGTTGVVYGWIRVRSGSTVLAAIAHATYNLTVLMFPLLR